MNLATFSMLALAAGTPAAMWAPPVREPRRVRTYGQIPATKAFPDWKPNSRQIRRAKARAAAKLQARLIRIAKVNEAKAKAAQAVETARAAFVTLTEAR